MERAEKKRPRGEVGRRCDSDCRARPVWPVAATAANTPRTGRAPQGAGHELEPQLSTRTAVTSPTSQPPQ
jgi:hypothetical protein